MSRYERLSFDDLKQIFKEPRFDHPSRRSILMGEPSLQLKCYRAYYDAGGKSISRCRITRGEFIPNPPGCVGLRKIPRGLEAEVVDRMKASGLDRWEHTGCEQFVKEDSDGLREPSED